MITTLMLWIVGALVLAVAVGHVIGEALLAFEYLRKTVREPERESVMRRVDVPELGALRATCDDLDAFAARLKREVTR